MLNVFWHGFEWATSEEKHLQIQSRIRPTNIKKTSKNIWKYVNNINPGNCRRQADVPPASAARLGGAWGGKGPGLADPAGLAGACRALQAGFLKLLGFVGAP